MISLPRRTFLLGLLAATLWAAGPARAADEPKAAAPPAAAAPADDPQASKLFEEVAKAYQALPRYADQGEFTLALTIGGRVQKQSIPLRLTLARPNKVNLEAGPVRLISDGKTLTTSAEPLKKYIQTPAPAKITFDTFREGPVGATLLGGPTATPMFLLLNLLTGTDPVKTIREQIGGALKLGPEREAGGVACRTLLIDRSEGPDFRLAIDPKTHLLRAIDVLIAAEDLAKKGGGVEKIAVDRFGWDSGVVSTAAPKDDVFVFQPPAGFTKVESFAQAGGAGDQPGDAVAALVGKPAPEFTLTVLDGPGKTKTLAKADLAGKVVLIDFWATWCGPCLRELPEVQKMIEAYAKDKKEVLIVALSQDREPADLAEVRKLVEKTLDDKKVTLTGTAIGLIALDPSNTIGDAFKVEAIPTLVLLDARGIVQAAHVGLESRETLTQEIDTLVGGKSLLKPKD